MRVERQEWITARQAAAIAQYPDLWLRVTAQWRQPGNDCAWFTYAANYLFRTGGVRWALDPLTLRQRIPQAPQVDLTDLRQLSFVLLTHRHADHLDLNLIRALRVHPVRWVIPEPILPLVLEQTGLPERQVIIPYPFQPIRIEGITITPFEGLHWEPPTASGAAPHGVPSVGYLVEFSGQRWLFPGDVRNYDLNLMPDFGSLEGVIAHLWLGSGAALLDEPPLLQAFCKFFACLPIRRLVVAHLHEFGRDAEDYWDERHYALVATRLMQLNPAIQVESVLMGQSLVL